jgi:hypothetical protein
MLRSIIDLQAAINRNLEQHNDDPKPSSGQTGLPYPRQTRPLTGAAPWFAPDSALGGAGFEPSVPRNRAEAFSRLLPIDVSVTRYRESGSVAQGPKAADRPPQPAEDLLQHRSEHPGGGRASGVVWVHVVPPIISAPIGVGRCSGAPKRVEVQQIATVLRRGTGQGSVVLPVRPRLRGWSRTPEQGSRESARSGCGAPYRRPPSPSEGQIGHLSGPGLVAAPGLD